MKVVLLANSVAIRVRPIPERENIKAYPDIIESSIPGTRLINHSNGAQMINVHLKNMDDVLKHNPDYYIINHGIVESCSRSIPNWLYRWLYERHPLESIMTKKLKDFLSGVENYFRRQLVFTRGKRPWISPSRFASGYEHLIKMIKQETKASIICIGINRPSVRIEKHLPGSTKRAMQYDNIIHKITKEYGCKYIRTKDLVAAESVPDGIHYNAQGHKVLADRIISLL